MGTERVHGERQRIVLDLEVGTDPITGTIAAAASPVQPFSGLMQLVAALDEIRESSAANARPAGTEPKLEREAQR
jgi:hypothetical protein